MTYNHISSVSYFTAAEGLLGEACARAPGGTQIREVTYYDGTEDDEIMGNLHICVMILSNKTTYVGKYLQTNPAMGEREARHLAYGDAERQALEDIK